MGLSASSLMLGFLPNTTLTALDDWLWQFDDSASLLIKHFGVRSLDGFGLTGKGEAITAAAACLRYAKETQRAASASSKTACHATLSPPTKT